MMNKTATIIGGTGLIGSHLLQLLLEDDHFQTIRVLVRRPFPHSHPKLEAKLIDFSDAESFKLGIEGSDAVFCAIGTTQQKVKGDQEAYRRIDYDIPVKAARFCNETGCSQFLLVSSVGADKNSSNFYLRLKGEVEEVIFKNSIPSIHIFRPSLLLGKRKEHRSGEKISQTIMPLFSFALIGKWSKYKPIEAENVAKAMISASKSGILGHHVYEYADMRRLIP
jgi:uncharacterized protein YbjT (DUF2867 family)